MALSSRTFTVLEPNEESFSDPGSSRRILVHPDALKGAKICAGDVLGLIGTKYDSAKGMPYAVGTAWPSVDIQSNSVEISLSLLLTAQVEKGSSIRLVPLASSSNSKAVLGLPSLKAFQEVATITVIDVDAGRDPETRPSSAPRPNDKGKGKARDWLKVLVKEAFVDLKYLTPTQMLSVSYEGRERRFQVEYASVTPSNPHDISGQLDRLTISEARETDMPPQGWIVGWDTEVVVKDLESSDGRVVSKPPNATSAASSVAESYNSVGGLDAQIARIRDLIEIPLTRPELFQHLGLKPPRGVLLHGPPGTGKTHLARAIATSTRSAVLLINGPELSSAYHGETEGKLRAVFAEAREKSPCIVVLDEVDALCPRRDDGAGGEVEKRVVATLLTLMDGFGDDSGGLTRVVVIATTNRPNAIDPALRRPGRFDEEIEIGVPDAAARLSILRVLLAKTPHELSDDELSAVGAQAHGYVGADLSAVIRDAGTRAIKRWLATNSSPGSGDQLAAARRDAPQLTFVDVLAALPTIRPSALRSLYVSASDVPVRYENIGGLGSVILKLQECVEWPLKHPETFKRLGVRAPRGVLLYGPPGCSKTMLARALACESGVNFIAVKGPELLSKFVGDSERSVRELFRKARGASPCILFFDEIDALASSRTSDTHSAAEGVLTSLLTEMDGVQELNMGVTILAATNRPEVIDSALMRPGRLDRLIYVGPPDLNGREEILKIRIRTMSVGSDVDVTEIARLTDGCSGAEIVGLCQEAALLTMKEDMNALHVPHRAFVAATSALRRQITPEVIRKYEQWWDGQ